MKRALAVTLVVVGLLAGCGLRANAQTNNNNEETVTVTVPKSSLTPQQQATLKQQEVKGWVGIGKEIGQAVNESLVAITTQANSFAGTGVGKLTVFIVIWKVVGDQVLHVIGGIAFVLIALPIWLWSYRRTCFPKRVLRKETIMPDKSVVKEYATEEPEDMENWRGAHWGAMAVIVVLVLTTMFSY